MSTEVQLYSKLQGNDPLLAIDKIGEWFSKSGLAGCQNPAQGQVLAFICLSESITPTALLRQFDICDGKLRKKALAILSDFRERGGDHNWIQDGEDGKTAEIELIAPNKKPIRYKFTIEMAQRQGLVRPNSNWIKSPGNMLRVRAISNGVAMVMPEIVAGSDDSDEETPTTPGLNLGSTPAANNSPRPAAVQSEPPKSATKIIDAEIIEQPKQQEQPKQDQPKQEQATDAKPEGITMATVQELMTAVGEPNWDNAIKFLQLRGYIKEKISELSPEMARKILKNTAGFLKAVSSAQVGASAS